MSQPKVDPEIRVLLAALDDAYDHPAWHGPNLRASLGRLGAAEALWRPGPKRHCIAEIALHCAYWKYAARRRLRGEKRGSFALKGSNWFAVDAKMSDGRWKEFLRLLDGEHAGLRETIASMSPRRLDEVPAGSRVNNRKLIYGMAAHDVYHAGQIRLIKSMMKGGGWGVGD